MDEKILKTVQPPLTQEESGYVALSPKTGVAQCANCRFFLATDYASDGTMLGPACVLVNGYPEPILATGWCNKHEVRKPYEPEPLEVEIVDDTADTEEPAEAEAVGTVTEEKAFKLFATPADLPRLQKLMRSIKSELQPGTTLVRKGGERYMLIVTSNGFEDRHEEHVATLALKQYVDGFEAGRIKRNKHMYWHAIEVGEIVAAGMVNGFLVEIAKEKGANGKKFYDYVEANPDGWGASQGFWVRQKDVREEGGKKTYARIDKDETTTLPRDYAANRFTLSAIGEDAMAQTKFEKLTDEIFGEGTAAALEKGTGALKKHLLKTGVELKQKDAETVADAADATAEAETTPPTDMASRDALLMRMIDGMESLLTEVKNTMAAAEVSEEKANSASEEMKALRKEVSDSLAEIREKLSLKPRIASQANETLVEGEQAEKAKDRIAPPQIQKFGGLELIDTK